MILGTRLIVVGEIKGVSKGIESFAWPVFISLFFMLICRLLIFFFFIFFFFKKKKSKKSGII